MKENAADAFPQSGLFAIATTAPDTSFDPSVALMLSRSIAAMLLSVPATTAPV
jgi:hypothetical protein